MLQAVLKISLEICNLSMKARKVANNGTNTARAHLSLSLITRLKNLERLTGSNQITESFALTAADGTLCARLLPQGLIDLR